MNLAPGVPSLTFSPLTPEILAVTSEEMKEAVGLVHHPSCTVFSNFLVLKKRPFLLLLSGIFPAPLSQKSLGEGKEQDP